MFRRRATLLDYLRLEEKSTRHQGRLRRGRLRRLHGGAGPPARRRASSTSRSMPASCSSGRSTASEVVTVEDLAAGGDAASGAAGDGRPSRLAMRLLHAGLRDGAVRALPATARSRSRRARSTTGSPAICAAAPATGRSSMRRWRPAPARRGDRLRDAAPADGQKLAALDDGEDVFVGDDRSLLRRARQRSTAWRRSMRAIPTRRIVAGATDVGLWITKQLRDVAEDHPSRPRRRARPDRGHRTTLSSSAPPSTYAQADAASRRASIPISANCCGASARSRCAPPARSAATSPTARRSATCRRR